MNIFYLDEYPVLAATYHSDKHVVKMILETAQILSTNNRLAGHDYGYQITHKNHPCTVWARTFIKNKYWLAQLGMSLCQEYTFRYGRTHACFEIINVFWQGVNIDIGEDVWKPVTPPALAMPPEFKVPNGPVQSYRNYYLGAKRDMLTYTKREIPYWVKEAGLGVQK